MAKAEQDQPQALLPHEEMLAPRVDLWIAAVVFVLGAAIVTIALQMPTYRQQGEIYNAPGLVPTVHGAIILLLSLWPAARSRRSTRATATRGWRWRQGCAWPSPAG